jgi:Cof subfamily protein (haloacid dehalogenase superfamily)
MRLFASDLDGTLLSGDFSISPENLNAIVRLRKRNVVFVIATGRSYVDTQHILSRHGLNCPVVCSNGAAVRDADGTLISKQTIPLEELSRLCTYMDEHHIFYGINSTWDLTMLHSWEVTLDAEEGATDEMLAFVKGPVLSQYGLSLADSFAPFLVGQKDACSLSIASTDQTKLDRFTKFAEAAGKVRLTGSGFSSLEVTPVGCSKASGLAQLGRFLGIPMSEMVSMGDHYNDIDMLLGTGKSFTVCHALEDIRAICTGIAPSCDENGVAWVIDRLLKEE